MGKTVMMGAWIWFVGIMLSAFMSGAFIGVTQQAVLDSLMLFTIWHIGRFSLPILNLNFFDGIWTILQTGNFSFLNGNPLFIIIYLLNILIVVGFFTLFSAMVASFIRR